MKIANILYELNTELTNHKKLDWINYVRYVPENGITEIAVDYLRPTLFIGWKNFKHIYSGLQPNILYKKYQSTYFRDKITLQWEFSMDEKITEHFTGIEEFVKNAPREYVNTFPYKSIDPIANNIETVEQIWEHIPEGDLRYYQYKDEIIYVLNKTKREIYGIYLTAFKYFGLDNKIIADFFSNKIIAKTIDSDASLYQSYYRQFPDFDQLKRGMVLFLV
jgi:hypothetical protein